SSNADELALTVRRALEAAQLRRAVSWQVRTHRANYGVNNLIGVSSAIQEVKRLIGRVAASQSTTVLARGESGTGKDLIAKAIHAESSRTEMPYVNITCTALQDTLLESELFGHEKGAFTDAKTQKKGLFELGQGGTVLLDEIGDMSPALQGKLLRVLEDKTFRRLGGTRDIPLDVRIVAATHVNLEQAIQAKKFREDLYYRLNAITIDAPALRDRREDIPLLAEHFLRRFAVELPRDVARISPAALEKLEGYGWPGNVRELRNVIERAVLLGSSAEVGVDDIVLGRPQPGVADGKRIFTLPAAGVDLTELDKDLVVQALERAGGNQTKAAALLGLTRDKIHYRMEKYGLLDA
ncbi:MAG: sigma-54 interaction domain-containing protein, partial [Planctomycetota bacterium]